MKPKYSLVTFLPAGAIILLTIAAYTYLSHNERDHTSGKFKSLCRDYTARVTLALDHVTDLTEALVGFYDGSEEVTRQEFQKFVSRIKEPNDGVLNFSWAPHVLLKDRARYESSAREAGYTSFVFTEKNPSGQFVTAESRPEYFPAYFIRPLLGNEAALGFDNASEPHRRQTMERARDSGKAAITEPVRLVQEKGPSVGVLLFNPVYTKGTAILTPEERQKRLRGFIVCVLRVDDMVSYAEQGFDLNDLVVRLEDIDAPEQQRLLYAGTSPSKTTTSRQSVELRWEEVIQAADRSWRLTIQPTDHFLASEASSAPLLVLIAGILVAALVQMVVLSMRNREVQIRQLVDERTDDLKKEKEFSETIINTLPAMFYLIDKNGRFIRWNRRLEKVTEYTTDEIARMHPLDFFRGESKVYIAARIAEVFETGESIAEAEMFTKSGKSIPYFFTGTRLLTADGEFLTGMGIDISERKLAEEERVLLQQQLQQAQKMEAIGQLTGGIAHDFNNILSSILGYTELVLDRYVPDKESTMAHYLQQVHGAGSRARDMVANMLAFSRGQRVKAGPLEVQPLVKEATVMLGSILPATVQLVSRLDDNLPHVVIDPVQLHQIVLNLCINARDAMEGQGRIEVTLSKKNVSAVCSSCHKSLEGEYLELAISDTGSGIPEDVLPRIFDPFFSTKEVGKGSGMGLSVVHGIVHEHNGHILVDSRPGAGAAFQLLLPAVAPSVTTPEITESGLEEPRKGNGHIMVVDDEEMVAEMMGELLKVHGYQISTFTDSLKALDRFSSSPAAFDAIVTDQTMPAMIGTELAQKVLALRPDLPIILCTGYSDKVDAESARRIGIRWFFLKPVATGDILSALSSIKKSC